MQERVESILAAPPAGATGLLILGYLNAITAKSLLSPSAMVGTYQRSTKNEKPST